MEFDYNDPQQFVNFLIAVAGVIGSFAVLATKTPNQAANKAGQFLLDLINLIGMNVGKAANDPSDGKGADSNPAPPSDG